MRPSSQNHNLPWLIDSVCAIPEWNIITDSKFRFPNLWLDDSIHANFGYEQYLTFPTLEVYFEQPYIVNDSIVVASDFFPCTSVLQYNDTMIICPFHVLLRVNYLNDNYYGNISLWNYGDYPIYTHQMYLNYTFNHDSTNTRLSWNGVFPIMVPPSGCYKPGVLRASVIGYDSAVVEWMSRFWLPESRVEYGPAGFAPDSGTVIEGVTGNRITLHGLSEGTDYEVRVSNWCDSAYSDETVCLFRTALRCEPAGDVSLFVATDTTIQL
ncbi:MAG: fibronectin type III domain-containing protein, partial [Bacteroidales bacterium]|nr:fibronectin type III domain-containing protein [Bacteroidales bacterium]